MESKEQRALAKKSSQLGMNISTASQRLVKDVLFHLATTAGHVCHHCSGRLTRATFSIEHKTPWLDSSDPVGLFFDLENIAFSHHACNVGAGRRPTKLPGTLHEKKMAWQRANRAYDREKRRAQYARTGQ